MQIASHIFTALWWLCASVGVGWAGFIIASASVADYPPGSTTAEIVLVIVGLLAIGLLPLRWIFLGRWGVSPWPSGGLLGMETFHA